MAMYAARIAVVAFCNRGVLSREYCCSGSMLEWKLATTGTSFSFVLNGLSRVDPFVDSHTPNIQLCTVCFCMRVPSVCISAHVTPMIFAVLMSRDRNHTYGVVIVGMRIGLAANSDLIPVCSFVAQTGPGNAVCRQN